MRAFDKLILELAPQYGLRRLRARMIADTIERHYEAAQPGRRTQNWPRKSSDANAANGPAMGPLRYFARDLHRNNPWARKGVRAIENNTVGWGINPKAIDARPAALDKAGRIWKAWGETTECDYEGRNTFYGLQRQCMGTVAISGEALVRRHRQRAKRGTIPLKIQILEPDFIDTTKDGIAGATEGSYTVQGIEFDSRGQRTFYWLYETHPGAAVRMGKNAFISKKVPASEILHVFREDRPGQVRGVSWFAPAIVTFKDFDEYEDATLLRQKIASCLVAFVTDVDGEGAPLGSQTSAANPATGAPAVDTLEPGMIVNLKSGGDVKFAEPPGVSEYTPYSKTQLRKLAAALGISYESFTGDYSEVNFSSARMSRLDMFANIHDWRYNMLIPQLCVGTWDWLMEAAFIAGEIEEMPGSDWTPPPVPMIEPDREGRAIANNIRSGILTFSRAIREQGYDPATHLKEYSEDLKLLDKLGITLDSDARKTSQAGLAQQAPIQSDTPPSRK